MSEGHRVWPGVTALVVTATACGAPTPPGSALDESAGSGSDGLEHSESESGDTEDCDLVTFEDPSLDAYVRAVLGLEQGPISADALASLVTIDVEVEDDELHELRSLAGLECAHALKQLVWREGVSSDFEGLEPLADLPALRVLQLAGGANTNFEALAQLEQLEVLEWPGSLLADLGPLSGLEELRVVRFRYNRVDDLGPLVGLSALEELDLSASPDYDVVDVSPLSGLAELRYVDLGNNAIVDASPLAGLTKLEFLNIGGNAITDFSALANLPALTLALDLNPIIDVSPLADFAALGVIGLSSTAITDLSPLVGTTWATPLGCADLRLEGSPLSEATLMVDLPQICADNPSVAVWLAEPPICNPSSSCACPLAWFCR